MRKSETVMLQERMEMVGVLRGFYRIADPQVLRAMEKIPRHLFIPEPYCRFAEPYGDHPCPIGHGQTISQPFIVAYMTQRLAPRPGERILEIGSGSGYQAAVLAELGAEVYTLEAVPELAEHARCVLGRLGYRVHARCADGFAGWPEAAPFDGIIGTCAPEDVPPELVAQLKEGGRMMLPVGTGIQQLVMLRREKGQVIREQDLAVRFVPMVHSSGAPPEP